MEKAKIGSYDPKTGKWIWRELAGEELKKFEKSLENSIFDENFNIRGLHDSFKKERERRKRK